METVLRRSGDHVLAREMDTAGCDPRLAWVAAPLAAIVTDDHRLSRNLERVIRGLGLQTLAFASATTAARDLGRVLVDVVIAEHPLAGIEAAMLCRVVRGAGSRWRPAYIAVTKDAGEVTTADRNIYDAVVRAPVHADELRGALAYARAKLRRSRRSPDKDERSLALE